MSSNNDKLHQQEKSTDNISQPHDVGTITKNVSTTNVNLQVVENATTTSQHNAETLSKNPLYTHSFSWNIIVTHINFFLVDYKLKLNDLYISCS